MLGKRSYRNYSYGPTGRTYKRRGINLTRPPTYRSNQQWQDWRTMKYIARRPLNLRTGGFIGKELKFVDYSYAGNVGTSWALEMPAVGSFNAVAAGSGESERIGRKITNNSLFIRGVLRENTSGIVCSRTRLVLVKDCQTNGASLTPATIMAGGIDSFRNLEQISRFKVLYDKTFVLTPMISHDGTTKFTNVPLRSFSINVKLTGDTLYDGPTAGISDITDNSYHLISICSVSTGVTLTYDARFRYTG